MRVLVCGGRDYKDKDLLFNTLNDIHVKEITKAAGIVTIIHGGAKGADKLSGEWAKSLGVSIEEYQADWEQHGRAAGIVRNKQMLDEGKPDIIIAFPGGKGTANMVNQATKAEVKVIVIPTTQS